MFDIRFPLCIRWERFSVTNAGIRPEKKRPIVTAIPAREIQSRSRILGVSTGGFSHPASFRASTVSSHKAAGDSDPASTRTVRKHGELVGSPSRDRFYASLKSRMRTRAYDNHVKCHHRSLSASPGSVRPDIIALVMASRVVYSAGHARRFGVVTRHKQRGAKWSRDPRRISFRPDGKFRRPAIS